MYADMIFSWEGLWECLWKKVDLLKNTSVFWMKCLSVNLWSRDKKIKLTSEWSIFSRAASAVVTGSSFNEDIQTSTNKLLPLSVTLNPPAGHWAVRDASLQPPVQKLVQDEWILWPLSHRVHASLRLKSCKKKTHQNTKNIHSTADKLFDLSI